MRVSLGKGQGLIHAPYPLQSIPWLHQPLWSLWPLEAHGPFGLGSRYKVKILIVNTYTRIGMFRGYCLLQRGQTLTTLPPFGMAFEFRS